MTERKNQDGFLGFVRRVLSRHPTQEQKANLPIAANINLSEIDFRKILIERAKGVLATLSESTKRELIERTRLFSPDLVIELLGQTEESKSLKFIRSGHKIIIIPSEPDHPHSHYAVVNGMESPDDAGMFSVDIDRNTLHFTNRGCTPYIKNIF